MKKVDIHTIKNFLFKNWGKIVLGLILAILIVTNINPGQLLIGNDNFSPELNPALSIQRGLTTPSWREYRGQGVASDSEQADLFRSFVFQIFSFVLPTWVISQGYKFLALFCGAWFIALCARHLASKYLKVEKNNDLELVFLVAGLSYLFTLETLSVFYIINAIFVAAYGFFPAVLYFTAKLINKWSKKDFLLFVLSFLFLSTAALTMTMFIALMLVYIVFCLVLIVLHRKNLKSIAKKFLVLALTILILSFTWLAPFLYYLKNNSTDIENSSINKSITPYTVEAENDNNTLLNTITFKFYWMDSQLDSKNYSLKSREYYKDLLPVNIALLTPFFLFILGSIYIGKRRKALLILSILYLLGVALIAGQNSPLYFIFSWLEEHVKFFGQALRWRSSKLWPAMLIPLSLVVPFGVLLLKQIIFKVEVLKNESAEKVLKTLALIFIGILPFIIVGIPMLNGGLIYKRFFVEIPKEYTSLKNYLEQNPKARIYEAPEANTLYFRNYNWSFDKNVEFEQMKGFWGSTFLGYYIPNPMVEKNYTVGSQESEDANDVITKAYFSGDPELFVKALQKYDIEYVFTDNSLSYNLPGYKYDEELDNKQVKQNPRLKKAWDDNFLELRKVPKLGSDYVEVYSDQDAKRLNYQNLLNDENSVTSLGGIISPFALNPSSQSRNGNYIEQKTIYKGPETEYSVDLNDVNESKLPSKIEYQNREITISPALPEIEVNNNPLYSFSSENINVNSNVVYVTDGKNYLKLKNDQSKDQFFIPEFKDSASIYTYSGKYDSIDLLSKLNGQEVTDCTKGNPDKKIRLEDGAVNLEGFMKMNCTGIDFKTNGNSILEFDVDIKNGDSNIFGFCVWSVIENRCVNANRNALVKGDRKLHFSSNEVVKDQTVIVYLSWQNVNKSNTKFSITNFNLNVFSDRSEYKVNRNITFNNLNNIKLKEGDEIKVKIPIIKDITSFDFHDENNELLPDFAVAGCTNLSSPPAIERRDGELIINNKGCFASMFPVIKSSPNVLNLIYYDGTNDAGTPLNFGLKEQKNGIEDDKSLFDQKLTYKDSGSKMEFMYLPERDTKFVFYVTSLAFKQNETRNRVKDLIFMGIPNEWLKIQLAPKDEGNNKLIKVDNKNIFNIYSASYKKGDIVSINEAKANGWMMINTENFKVVNEKTIVNGWRQSFVVPQDGKYLIFFWPNILGYIGHIISIVFFVVMFCIYVNISRLFSKLKKVFKIQ